MVYRTVYHQSSSIFSCVLLACDLKKGMGMVTVLCHTGEYSQMAEATRWLRISYRFTYTPCPKKDQIYSNCTGSFALLSRCCLTKLRTMHMNCQSCVHVQNTVGLFSDIVYSFLETWWLPLYLNLQQVGLYMTNVRIWSGLVPCNCNCNCN